MTIILSVEYVLLNEIFTLRTFTMPTIIFNQNIHLHRYERYRSNHAIKRPTAANILKATDFSNYLGYPLNTYVVINFRHVHKHVPLDAFRKIMKCHRRWLQYKRNKSKDNLRTDLTPRYVYAFENPIFFHVNLLIHVPDDLKEEFERKIVRWVQKAGIDLDPYDIEIRHLSTICDVKGVANYMIKGIQEDAADLYHVKEWEDQGIFYGQRAGTSRSIGRAAREKADFVAKRDRLDGPIIFKPLDQILIPNFRK